MIRDNGIDPGPPGSARSPRLAAAGLALVLLAAATAPGAQAQPRNQAAPAAGAEPRVHAPAPAAAPTAANAAKPKRDSAGRLSKFEARRFRQSCRSRANESGLRGSEREAFLTKCFFGRVSHRALRRECAQQGAAKGLSNGPLREFTRECVKERARPKD